MKRQFCIFLLRWACNVVGLYVAAQLLGAGYFEYDATRGLSLFVWAGLVLSLVNVVLKPLVVALSLPAILLTLGLFTLVVNGLMVYIAVRLAPGDITITFWGAVLAGIIVSLINYTLTAIVDLRHVRSAT